MGSLDYADWIREIEQTAADMISLSVDYKYKAKEARTLTERHELTEKANHYEYVAKEKLREAEILRRRI